MSKFNNFFSANLCAWYKKNARDLPWRRTTDSYKIWISEIMLQQTTVNTVIPYYLKWVKAFPNIRAAARAPLQRILKMWQGLGYYQRAKNLHKAAKIICKQYAGKIPSSVEALKGLPGFGPYTIGAVLSIAFDQRQPIIDANVRRVAMRQLALEGYADTKQDAAILEFLNTVMPQKGNRVFNQALMELGALICRNKEPVCSQCPVKSTCGAYQKSVQEIIPKPKERQIKDVKAVVALIERNGEYFIQKRGPSGLLADLWEFPGGKVERGESLKGALYREIEEELGVRMKSAQPFMRTVHFYTQFRVNLHVWQCAVDRYPAPGDRCRWVKREDFAKYPMPSGSAKIVDQLLSDQLSKNT